MKKKLLITGGTGFLGSNLIRSLDFKKYDITVLSKNKSAKKKFNKKNIKYLFFDISKKAVLKKIKDNKFNYVINFAGNIDHKNKEQTFKVHYIGLKNLISLLDKNFLELFIQIGTSLEYGNNKSPQKEKIICRPSSYYGEAKYKSSRYIEKNLKKYVILRLYQIYGPNQKKDRLIPFVIDQCLRKKKFKCSNGEQVRDFLYVEDLNNLIIKILKTKFKNSKIFNVGSGKPKTVKSLINMIVKKTKSGKPMFGEIKMRRDEILRLYPDIKKIKNFFNWRPKFTIEEGLNKTIKFYETN